MRVAGGRRQGLAPDPADPLRDHRNGIERQPVVGEPGQPGLFAEFHCQVGEVERILFPGADLQRAR